jgi:hypothetical protein
MSVEITIEKFEEYEKIRKKGLYNMFDSRARELSTLTKNEWIVIMKDYDIFSNAWMPGIAKKWANK